MTPPLAAKPKSRRMKKEQDQKYIRKAIEVASRARNHGNHPFGAILVGPENQILLEAENTVVTDKDITGHAETNLIRKASAKYSPEYLQCCTVYTSTEPCPMCAGAIFWSNVRRVVYGLRAERLYSLTSEDGAEATIRLTCREIFERGRWKIEVIGPVLEEEAEKVHEGFWL
jgi:tRNA(Arg) A34 adenosine deaminase TadA